MSVSTDDVKTLCAELLKTDVDRIEFPGGNTRDAVRVNVGHLSVIVTKRKSLQRAQLESTVLRLLNQGAAPVPRLIAYRDHFLIQQDMGSQRLSESLNNGGLEHVTQSLESALTSLSAIHEVGKTNSQFNSVVVLGDKTQWLASFAKSAERLGILLGVPAPSLDVDKLVDLLRVDQPTFIKWDARPGNAVVSANGGVSWIDWEHCGRRHPLDDVAWLLADEYTPYLPQEESALITCVLPMFANGYSLEQAHEYLRVFGTFHSCIRIAMILNHQSKRGWWDFQKCLELDRVGVVRELAIQSCQRAAHWSSHSKLTNNLTPWLEDVLRSIEDK